jgi:ATP-dependent RNA helicase RhlE
LEFKEFGFNDELLNGIEAIGFKTATPIQEQAIPLILEGKDIIASAQTGTGKTAAFLLPIINKIIEAPEDGNIKALVIVPTRELAVQIDQNMEGLSYFTSVSSIAVYGGGDGASFSREKQALSTGVDLVVGTPGRLIAHLNLGYVKVNHLQFLVLDEADRMLDMGFNDDIMKILSYLPKQRQNLLFSATMPPKMRELAKKALVDPHEINIAVSKPAERVIQAAFVVYETQKIPLVKYLLSAKRVKSALVFCSTKKSAKDLSMELKKSGMPVEDIHSDLEQVDRQKILQKFKNREIQALIATDILSRGIDIEDIDLVINFDVPKEGEDYIHRIGRTARAAAQGFAFTLINENDQHNFQRIEHLLGKPVQKATVPTVLGDAPAYDPKPFSKSGGHFKGRKNNNQKKPFRAKKKDNS